MKMIHKDVFHNSWRDDDTAIVVKDFRVKICNTSDCYMEMLTVSTQQSYGVQSVASRMGHESMDMYIVLKTWPVDLYWGWEWKV